MYNNQINIKRGSVITHMDNLYYIYGEENSNWQAFLIDYKKNLEMFDRTVIVNIDSKQFKTSFSPTILIPKTEKNISFLCQATDSQMDAIRELKKDYKKKKEMEKSKSKKLIYTHIQEKSIFLARNKERETVKYIVLVRDGNDLYCCKMESDGESHLELLSVNQYCRKIGEVDEDTYFSLLNLHTDMLEQNCKKFKKEGMKNITIKSSGYLYYIDSNLLKILKENNITLRPICTKKEDFLSHRTEQKILVAITINLALAKSLKEQRCIVCFINNHTNDNIDYIADYEYSTEGFVKQLKTLNNK